MSNRVFVQISGIVRRCGTFCGTCENKSFFMSKVLVAQNVFGYNVFAVTKGALNPN